MSIYCAKAPGKIILSGEHSVVHGAPAIVAAIAKHTHVCFHPIHRSDSIRTVFKGLPKAPPYPLSGLKKIKQKLDERFEQFVRGELSVSHILHRPDELAIYALATFLQHVPLPGKTSSKHLPIPGRLSSDTELPIGSGMGSSASAIAATIRLYEHLLEHSLTLTQRFELVRFCERLQHGKGSALDSAAVTYGNILSYEDAQPLPLDVSLNNHWYWVLHGVPDSSTGDCVSYVDEHHGHDKSLWQSFNDCTMALKKTLLNQDNPMQVIKRNDELLRYIGVVPEAAKAFIDDINAIGGAGKISGAGTVHGQQAGVILVYHQDRQVLANFMDKFPHMRWGELCIDRQGARLSPASSQSFSTTA